MNIKELRDSMNSISSEFDEFDVMFVETSIIGDKKISRRSISLESIAINTVTNEFMIGEKKSIDNLIDLSNTLNDGN
jgi:hypothetical protein